VGRRGPVRTADLWRIFFRHLPLWAIVFCVTWLAQALVVNLGPLAQLLICGPIGVIVGAAFIYNFRPQRQVASHLLQSVRELTGRPIK